MERLTERQQMVLSFIEGCLSDGRPPSQREVAEHFRLSQNAVYQLVGYLRRKGYLENAGGIGGCGCRRGIWRCWLSVRGCRWWGAWRRVSRS